MAIKRYYATADTTITDAYTENLKIRGSGSNMGKADTLEVFSIYDQVETVEQTVDGKSSIMPHRELARILLKFNSTTINTENPTIGAGANLPKAYLRLSNAVHPHTLPSAYGLDVYALDQSFDEGHGMDADEYSDSGSIGQVAAASWTARAYDAPALTTPATGTFHIDVNPTTAITVRVGGHSITVNPVGAVDAAGATATAVAIRDGINTAGSAIAGLVTATALAGLVTITADNIGGSFIPIAISAATGNLLRNVSGWGGIGTGGNNGGPTLTGGVDTLAWTTAGGDFGTATSPLLGTQAFEDGDEDLLIDVTAFFSAVRAGTYTDRGLLIKMSGTEESALRSFYTKKFFARSSQYFFLRPCIEIQWDDSLEDDRGNFYASTPLRSAVDNENSIVFKNYVDGAIAQADTEPTGVNVWVDSTKNVALITGNAVAGAGTGIYSSVIVLDTDLEEVYVEWINVVGALLLHSETITVKQRSASITNTNPEYVISITNLKPSYLGKDPSENTTAEIARFRLYTRLKDWSPTIYSKATKEMKTETVERAYYKLIRLADDFTVFDYGIGGNEHTKLSYDVDGSYFDIDMSLLEVGYSYGIKFMFVIRGEQKEQSEVFKFRVE